MHVVACCAAAASIAAMSNTAAAPIAEMKTRRLMFPSRVQYLRLEGDLTERRSRPARQGLFTYNRRRKGKRVSLTCEELEVTFEDVGTQPLSAANRPHHTQARELPQQRVRGRSTSSAISSSAATDYWRAAMQNSARCEAGILPALANLPHQDHLQEREGLRVPGWRHRRPALGRPHRDRQARKAAQRVVEAAA